MLWIITGIITSYLVGSIPTAYIFVRLIKGIDIRKVGSGNVGATNALRALGKEWGATVLILDIFKGFVPPFFLGNCFAPKISIISPGALAVVLGLCCICGHNWTIFLNFKGGKGIATTLGVLLALSFKIVGIKFILVILILVWLLTFMLTRIISAASITAVISLPVLSIIFRQSGLVISVCFLLSAFAIYRHKANITRLLQGKEPRLSFKKSP